MTIDIALVNTIIKYIEKVEIAFDADFGSGRTIKQISDSEDMPVIYYVLIKLKQENE